jgi:hypothetical protein
MKKLLFLICIFSLLSSACNKKNDEPVLTYFKCKIDGVSFAKDSLEFPADNLVAGSLDLKFESGNRSLTIGVIDFNGEVGTYEANWIQYDNGPSDFYGDMGTVVITEVNGKREFISGTFSGSCSPPGGGTEMQITDGEFVMQYFDM